MRSLFSFLVLFCCTSLLSQDVSRPLHELQLKRFDSKKKTSASLLLHEPDAFEELMAFTVYDRKKPYTGKIYDTIHGPVIEAIVNNGRIIDYRFSRSDERRYQHFILYSDVKSGVYGHDTVTYNGRLFTLTEFTKDSSGNCYMSVITDYGTGRVKTESYKIGDETRGGVAYHELIMDGEWIEAQNGNVLKIETFRNGLRNGVQEEYGPNGVLLQRYYFSPYSGTVGPYYEFDTVSQIVTRGTYSSKGEPVGVWYGKYTDSTIATTTWMGKRGLTDSSKTWNRKGVLIAATCYYEVNRKPMGYRRTWYENGTRASYANYVWDINDTVSVVYFENGAPKECRFMMNGRPQIKKWHENGTIKSEEYRVPGPLEYSTLRDSVYRKWDQQGALIEESFYLNGKFLRSGLQDTTEPAPVVSPQMRALAYFTVVGNPQKQMRWDTSLLVPASLIDSVAHQVEAIYALRTDTLLNRSVSYALSILDSIRSKQMVNDSTFHFRYNIVLKSIKSVQYDKSGHLTTSDPELNRFLDSLGLTVSTVFNLREVGIRHGIGSDEFLAYTKPSSQFLNLSYISRRLNELAPGSRMELFNNILAKKLPEETFYIPQGTKTKAGIVPVTVFAVIASGQKETRLMASGEEYKNCDVRGCSVFYIYGNGNVELVKGTTKDELLFIFFGISEGFYSKTRR